MLELLMFGFVLGFGLFLAFVYRLLQRQQATDMDLLDEQLGSEALPGDQGCDGLDDADLDFIRHETHTILGGTGLTRNQKIDLREGAHLLVDFCCQLCLRPLHDLVDPCRPRAVQPPPVPCTWCDSEEHEDDFCPEIIPRGGNTCVCDENPCECRY